MKPVYTAIKSTFPTEVRAVNPMVSRVEYTEYRHWFSIGVALRTVNGRFRCWCLRLMIGRGPSRYLPVWPRGKK